MSENGVINWLAPASYGKAVIYNHDIESVKPSALVAFQVDYQDRRYSVILRPAVTAGWMQGTWQDVYNNRLKPQVISARLFVGETGVMLYGTWREENQLYESTIFLPNGAGVP